MWDHRIDETEFAQMEEEQMERAHNMIYGDIRDHVLRLRSETMPHMTPGHTTAEKLFAELLELLRFKRVEPPKEERWEFPDDNGPGLRHISDEERELTRAIMEARR